MAETGALPQILIVTGAMAAGKSTVAQALAERLPMAVHLRGDVFRKMIVSGRVDPAPGNEAEWRGQLDLRYDLAAAAAEGYAAAGFTVIWQDILTDVLERIARRLAPWRPGIVVLCPSARALGEREAGRPKTGYRGWTPEAFDAMVRAETPKLGLWLDTTSLSVDETVEAILGRAVETRQGLAH
ncbi:MAG TPA: AAA family ATPase [Caulobacteraceae bacterium]|nr:AAA family ATPase [Caulobacteraceae bacterium]